MVAIDSSHGIPASRETGHTAAIVLFALMGSALLGVATLVMNAEEGNGWMQAFQTVSRFSLLLFVAAMLVEPLGRLIPAMQSLGRERASLTLAFAAASGVSLACLAAPEMLSGVAMTLPAAAYCMFTALILVVMLLSAHPATIRYLGAPAWRALHRVATSYFWIAFALTGIDHLYGPHRQDDWYGFSLLLLTGALLIRFADSFLQHRRYRVAGKVA